MVEPLVHLDLSLLILRVKRKITGALEPFSINRQLKRNEHFILNFIVDEVSTQTPYVLYYVYRNGILTINCSNDKRV